MLNLYPEITGNYLVTFYLVVVVFVFGFQGTMEEEILSSSNGDDEDRTRDPLLARQVLSQLSYTPILLSLRVFKWA